MWPNGHRLGPTAPALSQEGGPRSWPRDISFWRPDQKTRVELSVNEWMIRAGSQLGRAKSSKVVTSRPLHNKTYSQINQRELFEGRSYCVEDGDLFIREKKGYAPLLALLIWLNIHCQLLNLFDRWTHTISCTAENRWSTAANYTCPHIRHKSFYNIYIGNVTNVAAQFQFWSINRHALL